jgi:hypothetical protein
MQRKARNVNIVPLWNDIDMLNPQDRPSLGANVERNQRRTNQIDASQQEPPIEIISALDR